VEATDIYGYLRAQAGELGARILELVPPAQSTTGSNSVGCVGVPDAHFCVCERLAFAVTRETDHLNGKGRVGSYSQRKAIRGSNLTARRAGT